MGDGIDSIDTGDSAVLLNLFDRYSVEADLINNK